MKKMLLVFAHPDDESFTCGGTVAKYVKSGWQVNLSCATRGEQGSVGPYNPKTSDELGAIRQKELEKAAAILGVSSITFLGYKDGTLKSQHAGELEDKIYQTLTTFIPDVVITFEPGGISNHPDHIKLTLSTTYAFQKYATTILEVQKRQISHANPPRHPREFWKISFAETLEDDMLPKLYYVCMPESLADYLKRMKSIPRESFGKPWKGTPDRLITTVIDIRRFGTMKTKALRKHVSQRDDVERMLGLAHHPMLQQEHYVLRMHGVHEVFMGKKDRIANRL